MAEDKPLISIVMAVYHPRMDWLIEQLDSLNAQTYPNLELIVCDDGPDEPVRDQVFTEHITVFPWELVRNEENLGSNKTFERLTMMARGKYIAYCDQDDVWHSDKLERLAAVLHNDSLVGLVCSDMNIIDEASEKMAGSITEVRKHHHFLSGYGLTRNLLITNFVTGCTMLIHASLARGAMPFCPFMVHDHWLALYVSTNYRIISLLEPLIDYRIHNDNQTLMMAGVVDKPSYLKLRIELLMNRMCWLEKYFKADNDVLPIVQDALCWCQARYERFQGNWSAISYIWKFRAFGVRTSLFELLGSSLPNSVFMWIIRLKKGNIL